MPLLLLLLRLRRLLTPLLRLPLRLLAPLLRLLRLPLRPLRLLRRRTDPTGSGMKARAGRDPVCPGFCVCAS